MSLRSWIGKIRMYGEMTEIGSVARRYFVIGAFDGCLTVLGLIMGAFLAGASEAHKGLIIAASLSAAIALAISSTVGAYEAERLEKKVDQKSLEHAMLSRASEEQRDAYRYAAFLSAVVHGVAPLIAALLPILPYLFLAFVPATAAAVAITLVFLFILGSWLAGIAQERFFVTGLRFVAAGVATSLILLLIGTRWI